MTENTENISLDDIFDGEEEQESPAEPVENNEQPSEEPTKEDKEEVQETNEEHEKPSELEDMLKELETEKKRRKDNQDYAYKEKGLRERLMNKLIKDGVLDEQSAGEYISSLEAETPADLQDVYSDIDNNIKAQLSSIKTFMAKQGKNTDDIYNNFIELSKYDLDIIKDIVNVPSSELLDYVISKSEGASDVLSLINKHNGNIIEALTAKASEDDLSSALKEGYEKGKKETEEKYKEYISGSQKRPNLRSAGGDISTKDETPKEITLDDIFD